MSKSIPLKLTTLLLSILAILAMSVNAELLDPTRPINFSMTEMADDSGMQSPDSLAIQAIYYRPSGSSAMINGRRYRVNDQLAEYTIKNIMPDQVILKGAGESGGEKVLSFTRTPVKFPLEVNEEAQASQVKD